MSASDREQFMAELRTQYQHDVQAARPVIGVVAFLFSFGLFDLVWFGLALSTAYKIGATDAKSKQAARAMVAGVGEPHVPGLGQPDEAGAGSRSASLGIFGSLGREESQPTVGRIDAEPQSDTRREAA
jgi:hypothetical protein